ncbi:MAG: outer membrane lipoprotein carrier protein LolA [Alphaproteobacteria bacterium]
MKAFFRRCCPSGAALLLLLWLSAAAQAAAPAPAQLTPQDALELQRIAAYLNNIRTMIARFQQVASNGASTGRVWVMRPGRMRFEYDPPTQIALLADTQSVYYWDKELNQTSKYELRQTPAWFFLRDPISFGGDVVVTRFERAGGIIRVTLVESTRPDAGSLTLVFRENPLALVQWIVVDQQGKTTTVSLYDTQFGVALDPGMFQYGSLFAGSKR